MPETGPAPATTETHRIGLPSADDLLHAVPISHLRDDNIAAHGPIAPARCGQWVRVAAPDSTFDTFDRTDPGNPTRRMAACPACGWHVALDTGAWDLEIEALTPRGDERSAVTKVGGDPDLTQRLCAAAINATVRETGESPGEAGRAHLVPLLAQITAHRPVLTISGEDEDSADTPTPTGLVCRADSLTVPCSCGADHFIPECVVPAPCDVIRTIAAHLGER